LSERKQSDICIVSYPIGKAFTTPISNISTIFSEITTTNVILGSYDPVLISKNKALNVHFISHRSGSSKLLQFMRYTLLNIKIILKLCALRQLYGRTLFFMEHPPVLPMFFCILLGKRTYWLLPSKILYRSQSVLSRLESFFSYICYHVSAGIIVYSPHLITEWHLESYQHKILIAHHHFFNFTTLSVTTPLSHRPPLIGYIGRLSAEKGLEHFVQALPTILNDQKELRVLIGGDGPLRKNIRASLQDENLMDRTDLPGWISDEDFPNYLNRLQLLVLPSFTEGLPYIILEAMACGTPVLATPVGAIPDILIDGETGFIMDNNSAECIAENVMRALRSLELEKIADNGRRFVEENFTLEKTLGIWKKILMD
jgi:glycosyltransferase involved in cell wall biosynthesis